MKILNIIIKIFLACVILMAVIIGSIAVYMRYYGDAHIKKALTELMGASVKFSSASLNLDKQSVSFKGFSIASQIGFNKDIFQAETVTITLNKDRLEKEKKVVFDRIYIRKATFNVVRNSKGILNLVLPEARTTTGLQLSGDLIGSAPAKENPALPSSPPKSGLYELLKSVKNIRIEDSIINYEDNFKMAKPYKIWFNKVFADLTSADTGSGYISSTLSLDLYVPQRKYGEGGFGIQANMAIYPDKTNMEFVAQTRNIDLMVFQPYFQMSTPFYFRSGKFSSRTDFRMHEGNLDSLTTMYFSNLNLAINPYGENAQFLQVSINRLAPYLRSGENLVFDFVLKGDARNPQFGVGPTVKYAIGMVVMEEIGKAIQQIQTQ
jgi:hypothetical protein